MSHDNQKPAPPLDDAIDALDSLEHSGNNEDAPKETSVVDLAAMMSPMDEDVQRATKAGVSIATTLIEPLPADKNVMIEFKNGLAPVVLTKSVIVLGRAKGVADIVLPEDGQVSREHAAIIFAKGDFFLEDLESRNGTYYEGKRIKQVKLGFLTEFRVGTYTMRLRPLEKWQ